MVPLSVLDLSPIIEGGDAGQSLRNSLDLARHAEALGYQRYWMAEHHNMPGIASAATAVALLRARANAGSGGDLPCPIPALAAPGHAPRHAGREPVRGRDGRRGTASVLVL